MRAKAKLGDSYRRKIRYCESEILNGKNQGYLCYRIARYQAPNGKWYCGHHYRTSGEDPKP